MNFHSKSLKFINKSAEKINIFIYLLVIIGFFAGNKLNAQTSYNLTVESGPERQAFAGFGVSHYSGTDWDDLDTSTRSTMVSDIYGDLDINVFRMWLSYDDSYTIAEMVSAFYESHIANGVIDDVMAQNVDTLLLAPAFGQSNPPADIPAYASRIAEVIYQIKTTYGVNINVTGIANEPEAKITTSQIVECVKEFRSNLDSRGLTDVKIIASEASNPYSAISSAKAFQEDSTAWNSLYGIASHSYGAVSRSDEMGILKQDKVWWVTEASGNDKNEVADDENQACTVVSRFVSELNQGVDEWIFFLDFRQVYDASTYPLGTGFLVLHQTCDDTFVRLLKYYYFKQALNTFDKGCVFRRCTSDIDGDMLSFMNENGQNQNPAITAAAGFNPDGTWGISLVNTTGVDNGIATSTNLFYTDTTYNVTINIEELSNISTTFSITRSSAGNHNIVGTPIQCTNGQLTVSIGPKEIVSLRSGTITNTAPPVPINLTASTINAPVSLNWHNTMSATSWNVKRSTTTTGPYTTIANVDTTHFEDTTAQDGVQYFYVVSALNDANVESADSDEVTASPTPFPWTNVDVGDVEIAGSLTVSDDGTYTTQGSGGEFFTSNDAYNYTYQTMTGDGTVVVRLVDYKLANARMGIHMTEALSGTPKAAALIYNGNGTWLTEMMGSRLTDGGSISWSIGNLTGVPMWLKLNRTGDVFTSYASYDGETWTLTRSKTIDMADTIYIGLVNTLDSLLNTAEFDNVIFPCQPVTDFTASAANGIKLNWTATLGATQYHIKRSADINGPFTTIASLDAPQVKYTDFTLTPGTSAYYIITAENELGETTDSAKVSASLPFYSDFNRTDVGDYTTEGTYSVDTDGTITMTSGSGYLMTTSSDTYNFSYVNMTGDCTIEVKLDSFTGPNSRLGVLMTETLDISAKAATVFYNTNGVWLCSMMGARTTENTYGGIQIGSSTGVPMWLKLNRTGDIFTGYASNDGITWETFSSRTISMNDTIYVGLVVTRSNGAVTCDFTDLSISTPVPEDLVATASSTEAELYWTANEYVTGYKIKRATEIDGTYTTIATPDSQAVSYIDSTITAGSKYFYKVSGVTASGDYDTEPVEIWSNMDIGTLVEPGGFATTGAFSEDPDETITVTTDTGNLLTTSSDAFNFTYLTMTGDCTMTVYLESYSGPNSRMGILMTENLSTTSKAATVIYNSNGTWQCSMMGARYTEGTNGNWSIADTTGSPVWLKLNRTGDDFTGYASSDGTTWETISTKTVTMNDTIYVGIVAATSYASCTANFTNVTITP